VEPRPDEQDLVEQARSGDLAAFNLLVEHYQGPMFNLCLRMLRTAQGAEDATQEAFIAAYRNLGKFRGGSFRAWLFRIAGNACYDELRRQKSRPASHLEDESGAPRFEPSAGGASMDDLAQQSELREAIQSALLALPADQRLAIVLCDVQGMDYAEIAQVMQCSLGTIKSRINRGRSKLRTLLLGDSGELLPDRFRRGDREQ
jgi:RNA polymerase sigma-70 factor (ECF subfamily)